MPGQTLWSYQWGEEFKKIPQFRENYELLGFFYDHKTNMKGYDFKEKDLEKFVQEHSFDPAEERRKATGLKNLSENEDLVNKLQSKEYVTFLVEHTPKVDKIISENYRRFEIFKKKV